MRRLSPAVIVTVLLVATLVFFLSNFFIGKYFSKKNVSTIQSPSTAQNPVDVTQPLGVQMKETEKTDNSIASFIAAGDNELGGKFIQGVLVDTLDKEIPIRNKDGREIGKSVLTFQVAYRDPAGKLKTIYLSKAMTLSDGITYLLSDVPIVMPKAEGIAAGYIEKSGTMVKGIYGMDKEKLVDAIRTSKYWGQDDVELAKKVFAAIDEYEQSWKGNIDGFIANGEAGSMEFLFPLTYTNTSFNAKYGTFNVSELKK